MIAVAEKRTHACLFAAMPAERIHSLLRRMPDNGWAKLKSLMGEQFHHSSNTADIEILERMFRRGEAIGGSAGGIVLRMVQAMVGDSVVFSLLKEINEEMRSAVRFVLREMSDDDWAAFSPALSQCLNDSTKNDELALLELVFRFGESVSNVEVAAVALDESSSGCKLIDPEVARRNAFARGSVHGVPRIDPEEAYRQAKQAIDERTAVARRAVNTLASRFVKPTQAYKHARNTVFKMVDFIAEQPELMARIKAIQKSFEDSPPVNREQVRWALHRMPIRDRLKVIKWIPLNTVLVFQDAADESQDVAWKSARDRRLAYDLFVEGRSDEDLATKYGLSINAAKNAVGAILQTLAEKPLACRLVAAFLRTTEQIGPMELNEIRSRMKRISTKQRALILDQIPNCAWKARDVIHLHKHLFLDYFSGEWVLAALVAYYNLEKVQRLTGTFKLDGALTVRGAYAAIEGILHKIQDQPVLRQMLRDGMSLSTAARSGVEAEIEPRVEDVLPELPGNPPSAAQFISIHPKGNNVSFAVPVVGAAGAWGRERATIAPSRGLV